jgi:hypothetical protein
LSRFRDELLAKQGAMTGREFSRLLSIDPAELSRIRAGKEPPYRIVKAALGLWPELALYLVEDNKRRAC